MSTTPPSSVHHLQNDLNYCTTQDLILFYVCQIFYAISELNVTSFWQLSSLEEEETSECTKDKISTCLTQLTDLWTFDEFQVGLCQIFVLIFVFNLSCIYITWSYYGEKIYERFMKPTSQEFLENLRKSVAQLKLPKDYSPRL